MVQVTLSSIVGHSLASEGTCMQCFTYTIVLAVLCVKFAKDSTAFY